MNTALEKLKKKLELTQNALEQCEVDFAMRSSECQFAVENLKNRDEAVERARLEWENALDAMNDPLFIHDKEFRILRCNRAYQHYAGIPFKEIIGQPYFEIFPKMDAPFSSCLLSLENLAEEEVQVGDILFYSRAFSIKDEQGNYLYSIHTLEDITKRRLNEKILIESEEKFRVITTTSQDAILIMNDEGKIVYWNKAAEDIFGYLEQEAIGQSLHELLAPERFLELFRIGFGHFIETGEGPAVGKTLELAALKKDKTEFPIEFSLSSVQRDGKWNAIGIVRDITERIKDREQIKHLNKIYQTLSQCNHAITHIDSKQELFEQICKFTVETAGMEMSWIGLVDSKTKMVQLAASYGDKNHYLEGIEISIDANLPSGIGPAGTAIREGHATWSQDFINDPSATAWHERAKASSMKAVAALPIFQEDKPIGVFALYSKQLNFFDPTIKNLFEEMAADISYAMDMFVQNEEKEKAEADLLKTEQLLEETSALAHVGGWEFNPKTGQGTWTKEVALIHDLDPDEHTSEKIGLSVYKGEWLEKITATIDAAVNQGVPYDLELMITTHKGNQKWVHIIGKPIIENGIVNYISGFMQDISILKAGQIALHNSLVGTIQAMASTVEMRDPYTAGHQKRVAALSYAIAENMGMEQSRIEGLRLAAEIHDLGKLQIPAEILSKPSKLTDIEFMMLQTHPEAGYQTLKDIQFPWPIADIIRQHHEKLDGSGYPRGLKGDEIMLEARIVAVADVVEAMSSHRPYRAALGIDVALEEIQKERGTKLDSMVVDTCVALFKENKFQFPV